MSSYEYVDTNNVFFITAEAGSIGAVTDIDVGGGEIEVHYGLEQPPREGYALLVVDEYRRFLASARAAANGSVTVPVARLSEVSESLASLFIWDQTTNRAWPIAFAAELREQMREALDQQLPDFAPVSIPSYKQQYVDVVLDATAEPYVSQSNVDRIRTGNNYQTLELGDVLRQGGRPDRQMLLERIRFKDKTVLDIGANTGEISRRIRRLGAELVDGLEYDPFFVETGRAINAATGMTRVSLFQGDASQPGFYETRRYDIVVALAVYVYIKDLFGLLAERSKVLVLETHTLDHGLEMYIEAARRFFPAFKLIGYSDLKKDVRKSRALLAFASDADALREATEIPRVKTSPYFDNGFFERFETTSRAEFVPYLEMIDDAYGQQAQDDRPMKFGSAEYFMTLLSGYRDYRRAGSVGGDNRFLSRYLASIESEAIDPNLRHLLDDRDLAARKVREKFRDLDSILAGDMHLVAPIWLSEQVDGHLEFEAVGGEKLLCSDIDGHHRFFVHQLLGLPEIEYVLKAPVIPHERVVRTNYTLSSPA